MDELKELMGDAYKEDMSKEDIQAFFKKQVLASGEYTNSGKANAEKKELSDKIAELQSQLDSKMTDDDKKKKADADMQKMIEKLQKELSESKSSQSKLSAISKLAEAKISAGIKDGDTEFDDFVTEISFEDGTKTDKISNYVAKLVKNAYEAGKSEAVKNNLGKLGTFEVGTDTDGEEESIGARLGKAKASSNITLKDFITK